MVLHVRSSHVGRSRPSGNVHFARVVDCRDIRRVRACDSLRWRDASECGSKGLLCWNVFFVALTFDEGRQRPPPNNTSRSHHGSRTRDTGGPSEVPSTSWEGMDEVNLEEVFLSRTPILRSCFLRGRFRHSLCVALRERYKAKLVGEKVVEEIAWKLFGLVPVMLRHKPRGCGSVVKQELVERTNKFGRGQWRELLASLQEVPNHPHPKDEQNTSSQNRNDEVPENPRDPGGVAREKATREGSADSG